MNRFSYRPYLFLALFFFCVMSLSKNTVEHLRSSAVCSFAPCWRAMSFLKDGTLYLLTLPFPSRQATQEAAAVEHLSQENQLLRTQVENIREWLLYEDRIQEQMERYKALAPLAMKESAEKEFFKRRCQEQCEALDLQIQSLPAQVIFREPASWSSTVWINVGEGDNAKLGKKVVGKNSPVLLGTSIIGVVEYVGEHRSRVRLITDARLVPSVRAVRGKEQNRFLLEHAESLLFSLELRDDLLEQQEKKGLQEALALLRRALLGQAGEFYLAKGEIHGTSHPLWRSRSQLLKGVGFNYDFPDAEGAARDLRSGEPYDAVHKGEHLSLLREGDLLVTTGLDGVFPAGFRVAIVSHVQTLKEGASAYEIEAISTAGNLDELSHVFVLPPLQFSIILNEK